MLSGRLRWLSLHYPNGRSVAVMEVGDGVLGERLDTDLDAIRPVWRVSSDPHDYSLTCEPITISPNLTPYGIKFTLARAWGDSRWASLVGARICAI